MKTNFTKDELRTGDKVVTRDENIYLVIEDCNTLHYGKQSFILIDLLNNFGFIMVSDSYSTGLICDKDRETEYDIMKVYRDGDGFMSGCSIKNNIDSYDLIWSRE